MEGRRDPEQKFADSLYHHRIAQILCQTVRSLSFLDCQLHSAELEGFLHEFLQQIHHILLTFLILDIKAYRRFFLFVNLDNIIAVIQGFINFQQNIGFVIFLRIIAHQL